MKYLGYCLYLHQDTISANTARLKTVLAARFLMINSFSKITSTKIPPLTMTNKEALTLSFIGGKMKKISKKCLIRKFHRKAKQSMADSSKKARRTVVEFPFMIVSDCSKKKKF